MLYIENRHKNFKQKNDQYDLKVWALNTAQSLQSASVMEFSLHNRDYITIHQVGVIRDGVILNKNNDLNMRLLDDERASSRGSIHKIKKLNCLIPDIRLHDVIIFEYTISSIFEDDDFLDKRYFRFFRSLTFGYWFYKNYSFNLIQDRQESIIVSKKHFRNENGKMPDSISGLKKGEKFKFEEFNLSENHKDDEQGAYIEIATETTWEKINEDVYPFYDDILNKINLKDSPLYTSLKLGDPSILFDDKIQSIIEYVQNQIVYLYDAEVMHGYKPQTPEKTIELKSGDCKAKSLLLVCLLRSIGLDADIVLINYSNDYYIPINLPSPFSFNHAIVKIYAFNRASGKISRDDRGKDWFVDPTWSDQYGILYKREEPVFFNFLSIDGKSTLAKKQDILPTEINIEKHADVNIKNAVASVKIKAIYRNGSANLVRKSFKTATSEQILNNQNIFFLKDLGYPEDTIIGNVVKDAKYKIISDDKRLNKVVTEYTCIMPQAYQALGKYKVFKFYHHLDISPIINHIHKDYPCSNFFAYPSEHYLKIESDLFISYKNPLVKRETQINNNYFRFTNKKKTSWRKIEVTSSFMPKTYGYIKPTDFDAVKLDYLMINKSNYGVGLVFLDLWQYLRIRWYILPIIFVLIDIFLQYITGNSY